MRTPLVLVALVVAGCAVNPVTGKSDFVLISTEKEKEIGKQAAAEVQAEMGFYDRAGLEEYIQAIGLRLAAHSPRQDVVYSFHVIDSDEPNAFALPGGYVYVTRGLLVLANSEDELACVIGHEIGHVAARHSVRQISRAAPFGIVTGITSGVVGLASPLLGSLVGGVGDLASGFVLAPYSREQEREADRVGQQIAAESGWDPAAMATFLNTLQRDEQLRGAGRSRFNFLASHPATPERVENTEAYARELHRADVPPLSPTRRDFLQHFVGMPTGVNVANGYFVGRTFMQPDLGILLDFPDGWTQRNSPSGAMVSAPDGGAVIILSLAGKGDDPMEGARNMQKEVGEGLVAQTARTKVGELPAARTVFRARGDGKEVGIDVTWIAYHGDVYQITGITSVPQLTAYERPFAGARDSFRPLTPAERAGVRENRLRLAEVRRGETVDELIARTQASWSVAMLAVANDLPEPPPLEAGETVKVSVSEIYPVRGGGGGGGGGWSEVGGRQTAGLGSGQPLAPSPQPLQFEDLRSRRGAMRLGRWARTAILAMMLDDSSVEATTTFSPPVRNSEGDVLTCFAQNHSGGVLEVASVLRDESGAPLSSFSAQIPAGQAVSLTTSSDPVAGAYCEFEFDGDATAVRGFIRLTGAAGGNTRLIYEASGVLGAAMSGVATVSPAVQSGPADLIACVVQNLDSGSAAVMAQLRDGDGLLVAGNSVVVGAGDVVTLVSAAAPAEPTYCTFTFDGNPAEVRGYIRISGAMGGNTRLVAAAARAAETSTTVFHTPAIVPTGGVARCVAQNRGGGAVSVVADLLDADGEVIDASGARMVEPGHVEVLAISGQSPAPVSCRFTFAAKHAVRTYLAFTELLGGGTRILHAGTAAGGAAGLGAATFSPSLRNLEGSDLECWMQNLGGAPVDVAAALVDNMGGDVVVEAQASVAAGHTVRLLKSSDDLLGAYCRFVFDGSPADVRGSIVLNDGTPRLVETASLAAPLTPAPTATSTRVFTATRTPSGTPTATATSTTTSTVAFTPTPSSTPTSEASATATVVMATATPSPTASAPSTPTGSPEVTATASPTVTAVPSSTLTPVPAFAGDANCDDILSAADLVAVIGVIDSGIARGCGEDANGDGVVDAEDVEEIVGLIFGSS